MPRKQIDIGPDVYDFARIWWGLKSEALTDKKCEILGRSVSKWRKAYKSGSFGRLRGMYDDDAQLLGYLVAFGPRYAYTLESLLQKCPKLPRLHSGTDALKLCFIGGGSAVDLLGLLVHLEEAQGKLPRDVHVHFVDRSPQWRRFHQYLFGVVIPRHFRKTRILPYYHDVDLSDPAPRYHGDISGVFDAKIFVLSNVVSEFSDRGPLEEQLRLLTRCCRTTFTLLVADTSAPKYRPRVEWVTDFTEGLGFRYRKHFAGTYDVDCKWLDQGPTGQRVFDPRSGPHFMTSVKRWGFVAQVHADAPGTSV